MSDKPFTRPILIRLDAGNGRAVASAYEALECLAGPWPILSSHAYRFAIQCCRDSLDGLKSAQAAQHAFAEAAREAGVLVVAHLGAERRHAVGRRSGQMSSALFSDAYAQAGSAL